MIVAADIGGTKIVLAAFSAGEENGSSYLTMSVRKEYSSLECKNFDALLAGFADQQKEKIKAVAIGLAGPVIGRNVKLTNLTWSVNADELSAHLQCPVVLMNDLVAHTYGVLYAKDLKQEVLRSGNPIETGNIAVIAAGTGLGQALAIRNLDVNGCHSGFTVSATEGGHVSFAPVDEDDLDYCRYLFKKYNGHVSAERVISGIDGFENLLAYHLQSPETEKDADLRAIADSSDCGGKISALAAMGHKAATEIMNLFFKYYGAEAGNLCLKSMATSGLYICGGIAAKNRDFLMRSSFFDFMKAKGRFAQLVAQIPVHLVTDPDSAVKGAAAYAARHYC